MNTKKQLRAETGPMEFESDWRGIFIRGDNAAFYAMSLREFLQNPSDENPIMRAGVQGLLELLEDSNHFVEREVQEMKAFTECAKENPRWIREFNETIITYPTKTGDPIFQTESGWYFWDETWTQCFGSFRTKELAQESLEKYAYFLETGKEQ